MQFDLGSFLLGVAAPFVLVALAWAVGAVVSLLALRSIAPGGCHVCEHRGKWEVGERTNAAFYLATWRHDLLWASRRWHRRAWAAHRWNRAWRDGSEQHQVECNQPQCEFLGVAGPYSDLAAAVEVGRQHEKTAHGGALTTYVESAAPRTAAHTE